MKGYLFSLGAMLVGAGLMFVLMHGEVRAEDYNKIKCEILESDTSRTSPSFFTYRKIKDLTCVAVHATTLKSSFQGISCVKS